MFSPLQGRTFRRTVEEEARNGLPDSFVMIDQSGRILLRSDAAIPVGARLGGIGRALGAVLAVVPKRVRDRGYRLLAAIRYRLFAKPVGYCPILRSQFRVRFVE